MISGILAFLSGVLVLQQLSVLPAIGWSWGLLLTAFLPFISRYFRILLLFLLGFLWALWRAHGVLDISLPAELQGRDLQLTGVIATIPYEDQHKQRFELDIESIRYQNRQLDFPARVRLSWYHRASRWNKKVHNRQSVKAGQRWQFWVRLKQPHGFMNPGGFDYEGWLYQKKIRATGYVRVKYRKKQFARLLDKAVSSYPLTVLRQKIYDRLKSLTPDRTYAGILLALALGERGNITPDQWQVFRATGTNHLMAISGLHIGLLAGFIFFLARFSWSRLGKLPLFLAAPRAAAAIALLVAAFYAALSGFAVPAQRALIMLSIVMLSLLFRFRLPPPTILALALLGVLLLDPASVLSAGFWLSFAAVSIIAYAAAGRLPLQQQWFRWGQLQWRISLALIPLLIFLFQQASLVSPLANLLAIPVVSFLVVPSVLLATVTSLFNATMAVWLFNMADTVITGLWRFLELFSSLPASQWQLSQPSILVLLLAVVAGLLLLAPRGWPGKALGLFLILPLLWHSPADLQHGEVEFNLLDVGQGLAAVIRTRTHSLLFDTGPRFSARFDTGAAVVLPFLREKQLDRLDTVILSHQDNDHRGGFDSIRQAVEIGQLLSSYETDGGTRCRAGQQWQWDGVLFRILNPPDQKPRKRNNASCVLLVEAGEKRILLSADIEKSAERRLIREYGATLQASVLVAPHHGSKTSSSAGFLDTVKPEYVLIPVGYRNRYRMPHRSVMARFRQRGIRILQSFRSGAISLRAGQKNSKLEVVEYRPQAQRYWNARH